MTCALRGEKRPIVKCPICDLDIGKSTLKEPRRGRTPTPFNHLHTHSKGDLVRVILNMLGIPKSKWFKR